MQNPVLISHNANLPPNVSKENAFAYQTRTTPYHFDMPAACQRLQERGVTQPFQPFDREEDSAFGITDSEEEYETNSSLALTNADCDGHSPFVDSDIVCHTDRHANNPTDHETQDTDAIGTVTSCDSSLTDTSTVQSIGKTPSLDVVTESNDSDSVVINELVDANASDCAESQSPVCTPCCVSNEGQEDGDSDEDFFDNLNIGRSEAGNRRLSSLSYQIPTVEGVSSDENDEGENSESESNANDWVICEDMDS
jgi:hypothetical protein